MSCLEAPPSSLAGPPSIHIQGARVHNLRNVELRIPRGRFTVITGVSGSGKSSLAFDTLYAEGYRKYIESLSTQARQLLEQIPRPDVDFIHGLSPVVAIEQRAGGEGPRSTIASVTEIADYARLLWTHLGEQRCPKDGGRVVQRTLDENVARLLGKPPGTRLVLLAPFLTARAAVLREELPRLRQRGFQRVRIQGVIRSLEEEDLVPVGAREVTVELVVDRIVVAADQQSRLSDSLELVFREGCDRALALVQLPGREEWTEETLSRNLACEICGDVFEPLAPRQFSPNHPEGACPVCGGLGREMRFCEELVVPDPSLSVREGAIKPLRFGGKATVIRNNALLRQLAEQLPFDPEKPWAELPEETRRTLLYGAGGRRFTFRFRGARGRAEEATFSGVLALLDEARRATSSDGFRARLTTFMTSATCSACGGGRLTARSAAVRVHGVSLPEFLRWDVRRAHAWITSLRHAGTSSILADVCTGIAARLRFLREVGLDYLTLDRDYGTLSGGEAQRVRLATQLGMGLVGIVYVLDEPTIGLHPADNARLLRCLTDLRDRGNTLVVVEHDEESMRAADHLIEIGPGAGREGGRVIFQGTPEACMRSPSLTGAFLSGRERVERNTAPRSPDGRWIEVLGASENNLRDVDVCIPVGLLTCVTGVSGSGKSSLVNDVLARAALRLLNRARCLPGRHRAVRGLEEFESCVVVDQEPIGRSPRSNPATYTGLFDVLRELFAKAPLAKVRGYTATRFSFNTRGGRCERCQGDGVIRLDMQFLADVYAECPACRGQRYNRETLEVRFGGRNIAETLKLTVSEARQAFRSVPRAAEKLEVLERVGLGYLELGQPANTLSGGEAQRLKLSQELSRRRQGRTLYLLDEPTTGLHWVDVQRLLDLLFSLRDAGNTIVVIEHNLDVVRLADWVIDLGPGGGEDGGRVLHSGPPAELVRVEASLTGRWLGRKLSAGS